MIPDHLIDKAVHAAGENWVLTSEWEHDKLHAQVHAALEAVAADIWEEGSAAFEIAHKCDHADPWPHLRNNPYRASETA